MDDALHEQLEQERLLNQVTTQIRQSLELSVILSTAVEQLRGFLQVDRLLIYQLGVPRPKASDPLEDLSPGADEPELSDPPPAPPPANDAPSFGNITYEALSSDTILSLLEWREVDRCFSQTSEYQEYYRRGSIRCIADVETYYRSCPCLLEMLRQKQVRAKLVAPIIVQAELWGLLIAHQCGQPREWKNGEQKFLKKITEHLSIAIYQAQLYAQVQQQKHTLEKRVKERTQALHDALLAAQCANRAKSEFLATMSHELRTPLTHVIGISSTLLRLYGQSGATPAFPVEKQINYLQTIHDSGEHLLALINDILDLSQVEAGKTVLKISEFSLSKLVNQTLHTFRDRAKQRNVNLAGDIQIRPHRDRFIADHRRVRQILLNLLSNAIKFTPENGRVTLRVWMENKTAIFQVEDTGIGISEEQQPLLFEKFQQLDSPYRRQYGGTGLGLALTKQLVELHGGTIKFTSVVNKGTTFTVHIPAQPLVKKNPYKTSLQTDYTESPQGRLVVIEDDEETATLICELLTAAGYQVVWLMDGVTALRSIELLQPDAILVDLYLPGQNGYDIIRHLREETTTDPLKIIALTTTAAERERSLTTGADDCINKPILPNQLLNQIEKLGLGKPEPNSE